jgi:hypothetical protein
MAGGRTFHTATPLAHGRVLVAGGSKTAVPCMNTDAQTACGLASAEIYDSASRTWTPAGSMSTPRMLHTATLLDDGSVLVVGGVGYGSASNIPTLASAEIYDPNTGKWTLTKKPMSLKGGRALHTATRLQDGRVLVAGGRTLNSATSLPRVQKSTSPRRERGTRWPR